VGLADVVRAAVAVADSITASLQSTVQHYPWVRDGSNGRVWGSATPRAAVVDLSPKLIRTSDGSVVQRRAVVIFPRAVSVDPRDKIVLPDGTTGPIVDVSGAADPSTGRPYAPEVSIG